MQSLSFWEYQTWFNQVDVAIIGAGIVGLSTAIHLKKSKPHLKVLVLERGMLPSGASTKNAGFACFGSLSEIQADIDKTSFDEALQVLEMRIKGLELLKNTVGERDLNLENLGGYELFRPEEEQLFEQCLMLRSLLNKEMKSLTGESQTYQVADDKIEKFGFNGVQHLMWNCAESQIDTGAMMRRLHQLALQASVLVVNGAEVLNFEDLGNKVLVKLEAGLEFTASKLVVAVNGYAAKWFPDLDVHPARAQVLVTSSILNLPFKGSFHYQEGYYYFRNVGQRVLLGGGRNLDFEAENTDSQQLTNSIQKALEQLLREVVLPNQEYEIDYRWAGTLGLGAEKKPIISWVSPRVLCAVRLGGMGVAIGSLVGKQAAAMAITA
jgi:glycine/D-amino acid oxidase-like deaminating enzyme